jgi:hypothetical protein
MGVTVHYRGSIADLDRIDDFEDRVLDLVLELGGETRIWRSADAATPERIERGLMVNLAPGHETTSLLLSPEGWLIGLIEIEDAECGRLVEPPDVSVKTQFGPVEGHVAVVELLRALKKEFMPDLYVSDEGGYWESRDVRVVAERIGFLNRAMEAFQSALEEHPLSPEAAEDQDILVSRIERIARLVQQRVGRPAEHLPASVGDDDEVAPGSPEHEAEWDELFRENRRKQERIQRAVEERILRGDAIEEALDGAFEAELPPPVREDDLDADDDFADSTAEPLWTEIEDAAESETAGDWLASDDEVDAPSERDPLLGRAREVLLRAHKLFREDRKEAPQGYLDALMHGLLELNGGLAQVMPLPTGEPWEAPDETEVGLALEQLKRALRGAAFADGAMIGLRSAGALSKKDFADLHGELESLRMDMTAHLAALRRGNAP